MSSPIDIKFIYDQSTHGMKHTCHSFDTPRRQIVFRSLEAPRGVGEHNIERTQHDLRRRE